MADQYGGKDEAEGLPVSVLSPLDRDVHSLFAGGDVGQHGLQPCVRDAVPSGGRRSQAGRPAGLRRVRLPIAGSSTSRSQAQLEQPARPH